MRGELRHQGFASREAAADNPNACFDRYDCIQSRAMPCATMLGKKVIRDE
jgi:hypothetical protein